MLSAIKKRVEELHVGELVFTVEGGDRTTFWGEFRGHEHGVMLLWNPLIQRYAQEMGMPPEVYTIAPETSRPAS